MPETSAGVNDQVPTRASAGVVPPMLKGMPKHVLSAAMNGLAAAEKAGFPVSISKFGGFRTARMQKALYANRGNNPNPVAHPGESQHEHGLAIDVASGGGLAQQKKLAKVLEPHGWRWAGPVDPVHFDYVGSPEGAGDAPLPSSLPGLEPPVPTRPKARPAAAAPTGGLPATLPGLSAPGVNFTPDVSPAARSYPWHQIGATDVTARAFRTKEGRLWHYQMVNGRPQVVGEATTLHPAAPAPAAPQRRGLVIPSGPPQRAAVSPFDYSSAADVAAGLSPESSIPQKIAGTALAAPRKLDDIAAAAANVAAKHLHAKGVGAVADPAMYGEMTTEMQKTATDINRHVPLHAVQTLAGIKPGEQSRKATVARVGDGLLDFFFAPSNLVYGPALEATIAPVIGHVITKYGVPLAKKGAAKLAEMAPGAAESIERVGAFFGKGQKGEAARNVYQTFLNTRALLRHDSDALGSQIKNSIVEMRRTSPAFEAADNAFRRRSGGKSLLQDAIESYLYAPQHGLAIAKKEGIPAEVVRRYGDEIVQQTDKLMQGSKLHGLPKEEKVAFRRGFFHRLSAMTPEQGFRPIEREPADVVLRPEAKPAEPPAPPAQPPPAAHQPPSPEPTRPPAPPPAAPPPAPVRPVATAPARPAGAPKGLGVSKGRPLEELAGPRETPAPPPPVETVAPPTTQKRVARLTLPEETPKGVPKPTAGKPLGPPPSTAHIVPGKSFGLPETLQKAAPRYGYGKKLFTLQFKNELDKALYVVAGEKPSKADEHFMTLLRAYFPNQTDAEIRAMGGKVRESIKGLARDAEPGTLVIPSGQAKAAAKEAAPAAVAEVKTKGKKAATEAPVTPPAAARPAGPPSKAEVEGIFGERPKPKPPAAAQAVIEELRKTDPAAARRLEAAQRGAGPAPAAEPPKAAPPVARPAARPIVRERGELPRTTPLDPKRTDVPPETQHLIARMWPNPEKQEAARRLMKKFGVTAEEAGKWAESQAASAVKGEATKEKKLRARPGYFRPFASTAERAGAPKPVARTMAVMEPAGSKAGRNAIENLARQHSLEAAAESGLVKDLAEGEKPQRGWVQVPNRPAYGELAGKQVPESMAGVLKHIAEQPFDIRHANDIWGRGAKGLYQFSRAARLTFLHPLANPIGLVTSTGARMAQMEIGMERGLAQATRGKGALTKLGRGLIAPAEGMARLAPASKSAAADLGNWWRKGEDTEAMRALDKYFPTWRTSGFAEGLTSERAATMAGGGHFTNVLGKKVYIPPDWWKQFRESGAVSHAMLDQWAKLSLFKAIRGKLGDEAAAKLVKDHLFDYADQPAFLESLNRYGFWIFNAVPTKQAGLALRTLVQRPDLVARYPKLRNLIFAAQPGSEEQYQQMPHWEKGEFVIPTGRDKSGRYRFTNVARWIPFSGFMDLLDKPSTVPGEDKRTLLDKALGYPLWGPAVGALLEGKDIRSGEPLSKPGTPPDEDVRKRFETVGQQAAPTTYRDYQRLQRAYTGTTPSSYMYAEPQKPADAWQQVLGFPNVMGPMTEEQKGQAATAIDKRASAGAAYRDELMAGYKPQENPYRKLFAGAGEASLPAIRKTIKDNRNLIRGLVKAPNNYDRNGNLTADGKRRIRNAYYYGMAAIDRAQQLGEQMEKENE